MYLGNYLKRHWKMILMLVLFMGIFAAVFSLYSLPVEAVAYAAALCVFVGGILFFLGYVRYVSRHRRLVELMSRITLGTDGLLPPGSLVEEDYQALIQLLYEEKCRVASQADGRRSDMEDYYTLWAHQIKTPIAAMRLLLQTEECGGNEELSAELFKIEQYVEMALHYLRADSETTDYVINEYDLDEIIRQAVRKYARMFIRKKLTLDFRETNLRVLTDEKWLVFVLEQLLSNAIKYTAPGGKISVYGAGEALVVEDNGMGIREEDLPRVFEKGFTGYNGRIDKKSTGIGLYLCKRILTRLGHTVVIQSKAGEWTRVIVGLSREN